MHLLNIHRLWLWSSAMGLQTKSSFVFTALCPSPLLSHDSDPEISLILQMRSEDGGARREEAQVHPLRRCFIHVQEWDSSNIHICFLSYVFSLILITLRVSKGMINHIPSWDFTSIGYWLNIHISCCSHTDIDIWHLSTTVCWKKTTGSHAKQRIYF